MQLVLLENVDIYPIYIVPLKSSRRNNESGTAFHAVVVSRDTKVTQPLQCFICEEYQAKFRNTTQYTRAFH